jgi:hypothetical protein
MKKINWLIVGIIGILVLLFLFGVGMMSSGWGYGNYGYHGWGMMRSGGGMMGNWSYFPFGWIGMAFMWLIPIGLIALIVFGLAALVRNPGNPTPTNSFNSCSNCGKGVQADWQNCPYCGTALK